MNFLKTKTFHFLVGLSISGILIAWMYNALDWKAVWSSLKEASYLPLIPALGLIWLHFALRAVRWKLLLPENTETKHQDLFDAIMLGNFANFILPLRAGEFIRPAMAAKKSKLSFSSCFVSVVIERFFDLSTVLIFFSILLQFIPTVPNWVHQGAYSLGLLAVILFFFILLSAFLPSQLAKLIDYFSKFLPNKIKDPIRNFLTDFATGAAVLRKNMRVFKVFFLSLLVWGSAIAIYYVFLFLFDLNASTLLASAITIILALAVAAPSAPGFIGVYQTACIATFILFGINKEVAAAYAIATHAYQFVIFIVYGIIVLFKHNINLTKLKKPSEDLQLK